MSLATDGFTYLGTLKVPSVTGSASNVPALVKTDDFTATMIANLESDGGDLRFSSDIDGDNQLPIEIVDGLDVVWTLIPTAATDQLIYVWGNKPAATQPAAGAAFGRNAVWVDELSALHLEDSTYLDSASGSTALTATGTPSNTSAVVGEGLYLDSSDFISRGSRSVLNSLTELTISGWINLIDRAGDRALASQRDAGVAGGAGFEFWFDTNEFGGSKTNVLTLAVGDGSNNLQASSTNNAMTAGLHHIAATFDANSATGVKLYIDGVLDATVSSVGVTSTGVSSSEFSIGRSDNYGRAVAESVIDEVFISSSIKSSDFIKITKENQAAAGAWWIAADAASPVTGTIATQINAPTFVSSGSATLPQPVATTAFNISAPTFSGAGSSTLPQPTGVTAFNIDAPIFASTGSATLPNPSGSTAFSIAKPQFNATGSVTIPFPIGSAAFTLPAPTFNGTGSSTQPNPTGSASFDIDSPLFSAIGTATLPNPIGSVSFTIDEPTILASGSAALPYPVGNTSFELSAPTFAATGAVTLPNPSGEAGFTLPVPTFSATGYVSGFVIPIGSTIKLDTGSNTIKLPYSSNTIKL